MFKTIGLKLGEEAFRNSLDQGRSVGSIAGTSRQLLCVFLAHFYPFLRVVNLENHSKNSSWFHFNFQRKNPVVSSENRSHIILEKKLRFELEKQAFVSGKRKMMAWLLELQQNLCFIELKTTIL